MPYFPSLTRIEDLFIIISANFLSEPFNNHLNSVGPERDLIAKELFACSGTATQMSELELERIGPKEWNL